MQLQCSKLSMCFAGLESTFCLNGLQSVVCGNGVEIVTKSREDGDHLFL